MEQIQPGTSSSSQTSSSEQEVTPVQPAAVESAQGAAQQPAGLGPVTGFCGEPLAANPAKGLDITAGWHVDVLDPFSVRVEAGYTVSFDANPGGGGGFARPRGVIGVRITPGLVKRPQGTGAHARLGARFGKPFAVEAEKGWSAKTPYSIESVILPQYEMRFGTFASSCRFRSFGFLQKSPQVYVAPDFTYTFSSLPIQVGLNHYYPIYPVRDQLAVLKAAFVGQKSTGKLDEGGEEKVVPSIDADEAEIDLTAASEADETLVDDAQIEGTEARTVDEDTSRPRLEPVRGIQPPNGAAIAPLPQFQNNRTLAIIALVGVVLVGGRLCRNEGLRQA